MLTKHILFIDPGSSAIKGTVFRTTDGKIIAKHLQEDSGIFQGTIRDSELFHNSVKKLKKHLEKEIKSSLESAVLLIGLDLIKFKNISIKEISLNAFFDENMFKKLESQMKSWAEKNSSWLIRSNFLKYFLNQEEIENPKGLYVEKLKANANVAYAKKSSLGNMIMVLESVNLNIIDIIPSIFSCAQFHLSEDERKLGSLILDIGESGINWAFYYKNKPYQAGSINHSVIKVIKKLAQKYSIPIKEAKKLMEMHVSAIIKPESFCAWAEIKNEYESEFVLESEVSRTVQGEIEELKFKILKLIKSFEKSAYLCSLCGSGTWLKCLDELLQKNTSMQIMVSPSQEPAFDSLYGSMLTFEQTLFIKKNSIFKKAIYWLKNNL